MVIAGAMFLAAGCGRSDHAAGEVVLYTSIDEPVATPILRAFEARSGIHVIVKTDAEATRTVGLAERLLAEKDRPQADVWWGNEIFHTIHLAGAGVLERYSSAATTRAASEAGEQYRDPQQQWYCNGLRARVIVTAAHHPPVADIEALADPSLKGHIAVARPTAGTTGGHVAALYVLWGDDKADRYFHALRANQVQLLGGNSVVADSVGSGSIIAGLTDNDDAAAAQREGGKLTAALPDQSTVGTLAIPTTIAMVKGAPHAQAAAKLMDFLISADVERMLMDEKFAGWSVRTDGAGRFKSMPVDYLKVAQALPRAVQQATAILEGRQ